MMALFAASSFTLESSGEKVSPGGLLSIIKGTQSDSRKELVLEGEVTADELIDLRSLSPATEVLDLRNLVILPANHIALKGQGDSTMGEDEFPPYTMFGSKVKRIILPSTLKTIGNGAFAESSLESVEFPASLQKIGDHAFYRCVNLKEVDMSQSHVVGIPDHCFYGCTVLENVNFSPSTENIGEKAFMNTGIRKLNLSGVSRIGVFAFSSLPSLEELTLRNGVEIEEGAFYGNSQLTRLAGMPQNSPQLAMAGSGSKMNIVRIASEVIEPGAYAGLDCETIKLGSAVREIRENAFRNAHSLSCVDVVACGSNPPVLDAEGFADVDVTRVTLKVLIGDEEPWLNSAGWKDFIIVSSSDVEEVGISGSLRIEKVGSAFSITSPEEIHDIEVYNPAGVILHRASPRAESYRTPEFSEERIVIIRIVTPQFTKVATITVGS